MATYILINTVQVGLAKFKSGSTINSVFHPIATIQSAGGLLVATATHAACVAAGAEVVKQWALGKEQSVCDAMMAAAYSADIEAIDATHDAVVATGITLSNKVMFSKPIAAELISIFADATMAAGALALIANKPNVPCKLQVRLTCIGGISAGVVTLVGVGADGAALTQAIPLTGVTRTVVTTDAYATLTSATITAMAGNVAGDHISIGCSGALGLPIPAGATGVSVHKATVDYVDEAVGTVDATARTVTPTTAANGTREFEFWYKYTVSHTHSLS